MTDQENRITVRLSDKTAARIEELVEQGEFKNEANAIRYYVRSGLQREMINA